MQHANTHTRTHTHVLFHYTIFIYTFPLPMCLYLGRQGDRGQPGRSGIAI